MTKGPSDTKHEQWLDLSEAARYLGVHFTTLRRWADAGEVACIRTPGGRRRFAVADLENFMGSLRQKSRSLVPLESRALDVVRQELQVHHAAQGGVLSHFGEQQRSWFKYSGQRLLGLLIQYGSRGESGDVFLEEGRRLASEYGALCFQAGLTVGETVKTFLFFGHSMMNTVQESGNVHGSQDDEGRRLYQRMNDFLDAIMLAALETYCSMQSPASSQSSKG